MNLPNELLGQKVTITSIQSIQGDQVTGPHPDACETITERTWNSEDHLQFMAQTSTLSSKPVLLHQGQFCLLP